MLIAIGVLQLARHQFAEALETGRAALAIAPIAEARGVVVDALTELGRYDEAVEELQLMVDQKPNLASFSRVSYARELRGDLEGALDALDLAEEAGGGVAENLAFVAALKGNLLTYLGRPVEAAAAYERALGALPELRARAGGPGAARRRTRRPRRRRSSASRKRRRSCPSPNTSWRWARPRRPRAMPRRPAEASSSCGSKRSCLPPAASPSTWSWRCSRPTTAIRRPR